jgi:Tfp pilus assembly PilM family ATPase
MMRTFPPDVVVLDTDSLIHARLARGRNGLQVSMAKSYRLAGNTFGNAVVTPELTNEAALADTLRRVKNETGKWERASLLLPDSWFRMNIVELPSLPDKQSEAREVVRWSLKRTLPIAPETLRITWTVLSKSPNNVKLLVLSAVEATLAAIEKAFAAAGLDVVLIEPLGLNIWNAVAVREGETMNDRLLLYVRDREFTTAVFRGEQPLFIRSRNLGGERGLEQEIRLSASYLRDNLGTTNLERCYVAGSGIDGELASILAEEFSAPVQRIELRDFAQQLPTADALGIDAELTACTGVFTG